MESDRRNVPRRRGAWPLILLLALGALAVVVFLYCALGATDPFAPVGPS